MTRAVTPAAAGRSSAGDGSDKARTPETRTAQTWIDAGAGPAIVFSHGTFMDRTMFAPQVEALARDWRVVAYDSRVLAGPNVPHTLDDLVDDAVALLDRLGIERCVLAGMSLGGFMAMQFALRHPERLDGLVLIDAFAKDYSAEERAQFGPKFRELDRDGMIPRPFAEWVAPICFGATTLRRDPALVRHWVERWCGRIPARAVWHQALSWLDKPDHTPLLGRIEVPTLILCGEEDVRMPKGHLQEMLAALPYGELVTIPEAGHTSNLENPEATNRALSAFMARVHGPGAARRPA